VAVELRLALDAVPVDAALMHHVRLGGLESAAAVARRGVSAHIVGQNLPEHLSTCVPLAAKR
jgi:hypothetical protein